MEAKEYEVEVVYRQRAVYRVQADDREAAERLAVDCWQEGRPSEVPGYDWCELEMVAATEAGGEIRRQQDAELVLRFLRERERLILKLGGSAIGGPANDAISAAQVATDLGWARRGRDGASVPDVVRATDTLELLCRTRRAVCFERPRVRSGERGEIRLYCTPEYLEHLSSALEELDERQAV